MHMPTNTCTHAHIDTYTSIHLSIHPYIHASIHQSIHARVRTHTYIQIHIYAYIRIQRSKSPALSAASFSSLVSLATVSSIGSTTPSLSSIGGSYSVSSLGSAFSSHRASPAIQAWGVRAVGADALDHQDVLEHQHGLHGQGGGKIAGGGQQAPELASTTQGAAAGRMLPSTSQSAGPVVADAMGEAHPEVLAEASPVKAGRSDARIAACMGPTAHTAHPVNMALPSSVSSVSPAAFLPSVVTWWPLRVRAEGWEGALSHVKMNQTQGCVALAHVKAEEAKSDEVNSLAVVGAELGPSAGQRLGGIGSGGLALAGRWGLKALPSVVSWGLAGFFGAGCARVCAETEGGAAAGGGSRSAGSGSALGGNEPPPSRETFPVHRLPSVVTWWGPGATRAGEGLAVGWVSGTVVAGSSASASARPLPDLPPVSGARPPAPPRRQQPVPKTSKTHVSQPHPEPAEAPGAKPVPPPRRDCSPSRRRSPPAAALGVDGQADAEAGSGNTGGAACPVAEGPATDNSIGASESHGRDSDGMLLLSADPSTAKETKGAAGEAAVTAAHAISLRDTCPRCGVVVGEAEVRRGWRADEHDYTTGCVGCGRRSRSCQTHAAICADARAHVHRQTHNVMYTDG